MADEIDRAQAQEEQLTAIAQRFRKREGPEPTGFCLNCGEPLRGAHRWCDADCRTDYELRTGGV